MIENQVNLEKVQSICRKHAKANREVAALYAEVRVGWDGMHELVAGALPWVACDARSSLSTVLLPERSPPPPAHSAPLVGPSLPLAHARPFS